MATTFSFFLRNGGVIEWPAPDGMTMADLVQRMNDNGGHLAADLYIPADMVNCIGMNSGTAKINPMPTMTVQ